MDILDTDALGITTSHNYLYGLLNSQINLYLGVHFFLLFCLV
jgi:hypothetical protein